MTQATPLNLPLGFEAWNPVLQAATLAVLTFVQEDLPTISAALLAATGKLSWSAGFLGCFLGIWIGDLLLYGIARGAGRPLLEKSWARRFFNKEAVARSEKWFETKGTWLLVTSRFIPGTRLPTYTAAGFLKVPFQRFLLVTGLAVGFWTVGIFVLARFFGVELFAWLGRWKHGGWAILATVVLLMLLLRLLLTVFQPHFRQKLHGAISRWTRWEFWPPWLFYPPVILHYTWLSLRHGGFTVPTASNPGIFSGGLVGESKIATLRELHKHWPEFTAEAWLVEGATPAERLARLDEIRATHQVNFPFILKPDLGQRGLGVKLIRSQEQAAAYFRATDVPVVLQMYAEGPGEAGIFYYRFPHETQGRIFSITEKIFPTLAGDGKSTIEEIIYRDARAHIIAAKYLARLGERRSHVPAPGERVRLVEAGNHAQGCIFRDGRDLCTPDLERRMDEISRGVPGFFIGRYDLRYVSKEELMAGRNFRIIELNGASAEASSIYDERNSLWSAYGTLFKQWNLVFAIGAANRALGTKPMKLGIFLKQWRVALRQMSALPLAD